ITYTYTVVASNSLGDSPASNSATARPTSPTPVFQYYSTATSYPGTSWRTVGGSWSQTTTTDDLGNTVGTLSQTTTTAADIKKAIVQQPVNNTDVIITALVHIDSW